MKIERFEDIEAWPACAFHADRQPACKLTQNYEEHKTTNRDYKTQKVTDQKKSGTRVSATWNCEPDNLSSYNFIKER